MNLSFQFTAARTISGASALRSEEMKILKVKPGWWGRLSSINIKDIGVRFRLHESFLEGRE